LQLQEWSGEMLTIVKRSFLALTAFLALPPHAHEFAVAPSAVSRGAAGDGAPSDSARRADVLQVGDDAANGQKALSEARAVDRAPPAPMALAKLPLEIGDKLKIGFYETIDMGGGGQGSPDGAEPQNALRTFYQRMDLSGDYMVEQDGSISIPLLGQVPAAGRALDDLRADLAASFASVIGRSANIDARIMERSPVYVVGPVKNPGAYRYAPRMIALQAVALAGGLDRGEDNLSGMVEGAREMERLRTSTVQIEQLLARRARLEAELDGISASSTSDGARSMLWMRGEGATTALTPSQFAESDQGRSAGSFFATESTILRAEHARRQQQEKDSALRIEAGQNEIDALKHKLVQFDVQKGLRVERLEAMEKLKERGVETSNNVLVLRTEMSDIEARRQDSQVAVVQAETRLAEVEGESKKSTLEYRENLAKEIAAVDKDLREARETTLSARALATIYYKPNSPSAQATSYEIIRQSRDGPKSLSATETSPLIPGDVLKVIPGNAVAVDSNSALILPQSLQ
jgi:polysaccharide biosynthesis/export protein ExoF